jgi:hypothetical protein
VTEVTLDDDAEQLDAIWELAHVQARDVAFPDWPLTPIDREDQYERVRDTVAAYLNEALFR